MSKEHPTKNECLEIRQDGRILLHGFQSQQQLLNKVGTFSHFPAGAETLHFSRILTRKDEKELIPDGRVLLYGELGRFQPVGSIIAYLHSSQMTCWVSFLNGPVRRSLIFRNGNLIGARSNGLEDRLGEILIRYGVISPDTLAQVLRTIPPGRRFGAFLLQSGILDGQTLWTNIHRQMQEVFFGVLAMESGEFICLDANVSAFPDSLALDTQILLLEGMQRLDEVTHYRTRLPSRNTVVARRSEVEAPSESDSSRQQRLLFDLLEAPDTIGYLARRSCLGEYATTKALFALLKKGAIEVRDSAVPDTSDPVAVVSIYNLAFSYIHGVLKSTGLEEKLNRALTMFLSVKPALQTQGRLAFQEDGTLQAEILVSAAQEGLLSLPEDLKVLMGYMVIVACESLDRIGELELWVHLDDLLGGF